MLGAHGTSIQTSTTKTLAEQLQDSADRYNRASGKLTGVDCPVCMNRGYVYFVDNGVFGPSLSTRDCECMVQRRSIQRIERSGLKDLMQRYTFDTWQTPQRWQESARRLARRYVDERKGWFLAAGRSGSGKTHLCTAICAELLAAGMGVRYVLWRDMSVKAKAAVTDDEEYDRIIDPLKRVKVLYIDDLFKTKAGAEVKPADVNLAFEILNYRYNDSGKLTIISTEKGIEDLLDIDEATGSRIYERSKGYRLDMSGKSNWRLRDGG